MGSTCWPVEKIILRAQRPLVPLILQFEKHVREKGLEGVSWFPLDITSN